MARSLVRAFAALAAALSSAATASGAPRALTAEIFAQGAFMESPDLSPSGRKLVFVGHADGQRVVALRDLDTGATRAVMAGEAKTFFVRYCSFKSETVLLCSFGGWDFEAGRPFGISRLVSLDLSSDRMRVLVQNGTRGESQFQDRIVAWLPDDPNHVLIALGDDGRIFPGVFRLNVTTGRTAPYVRPREPIMGWLGDRQGEVRFGYGFNASTQRGVYVVRPPGEEGWRTLERFDLDDGARFEPIAFGPTPDSLIVQAEHNGREAIWDFDVTQKRPKQLLFSDPLFDVGAALLWPTDRRLIGFLVDGEKPRRFVFDDEAQSVYAAIDKALPDSFNRVVAASRDGQRLVIASFYDTRPTRYAILDRRQGALRIIASQNGMLDDAGLSKMQPITIEGPGGLDLPGYLTLPPGRAPEKLPLVVMPHGGPYARDSWGFDPLLQFIASRGYAVLQVNFRGSTGYGSAWLAAGHQGWGTVMHDDITASARWAIAQGIADPNRICIVGWSYGGYAALIGAIKEPGLYRCAASIAGVSDLVAIQNQDDRFYGGRASARRSIGTEDLRENSPVRRAADIRIPVLLVHGTDDISVVVDHSRNMARALDAAGNPARLVLIENGDHSLLRPSARLTLYRELEAFLARSLATR